MIFFEQRKHLRCYTLSHMNNTLLIINQFQNSFYILHIFNKYEKKLAKCTSHMQTIFYLGQRTRDQQVVFWTEYPEISSKMFKISYIWDKSFFYLCALNLYLLAL